MTPIPRRSATRRIEKESSPSSSARAVAAATTSSTLSFVRGPRDPRGSPSRSRQSSRSTRVGSPSLSAARGLPTGSSGVVMPLAYFPRTVYDDISHQIRTLYEVRSAMTSDPTLRARGLRKRYGTTAALDGFDLDVGGGIHGLLGANGAGKS